MGLFDSLYRNRVGLPAKSEVFEKHLDVYRKIITDKNTMEEKALADLETASEWQEYLFRRLQLDNLSKSANVSYEEWLELNHEIENLKEKIISDFINTQDENTIYGVLRDRLRNLKKNNISLPNMDRMYFDLWEQIVSSAELAELTITQIVNSNDYRNAVKNDRLIRDYQVRNHFRK